MKARVAIPAFALLSACSVTVGRVGEPAAATDAKDEIRTVTQDWPAGPRLAAEEMIAKYGKPREATPERLVWHDAGAFKRITVTREQLPHDFPVTHMDYLEHTISYQVPPDKADDLLAFDASLTIYPVGGELSARCDLESNNIVTLNLAHDIVTDKKSVDEARREFPEIVKQRSLAQDPAYAADLQFDPVQVGSARRVEEVTVDGSPVRATTTVAGEAPLAMAASTARGGTRVRDANSERPRRNGHDEADERDADDAEILASLVTLHENEVRAAMLAQQEHLDERVAEYARMLHREHGAQLEETIALAKRLGLRPVETRRVEQLHTKHTGRLADIVPLEGGAFSAAFLDLMIQAHTDGIERVDQDLRRTQRDELRQHLEFTREHLSMHLERAKSLKR